MSIGDRLWSPQQMWLVSYGLPYAASASVSSSPVRAGIFLLQRTGQLRSVEKGNRRQAHMMSLNTRHGVQPWIHCSCAARG